MDNNLIQLYANTLEASGSVTFYNGDFYEIYVSEGGYMVDVFEVTEDNILQSEPESKIMRPVDGGFCTGTAIDAITFMIMGEGINDFQFYMGDINQS